MCCFSVFSAIFSFSLFLEVGTTIAMARYSESDTNTGLTFGTVLQILMSLIYMVNDFILFNFVVVFFQICCKLAIKPA